MATRDAVGPDVRAHATVQIPAPRRSWDPPAGEPPPTVERPRRRVRRFLAVLGLVVLALVLVAVAVSVSLTSRMHRIEGAFDGLSSRPASAPGETILMVGTRPGGSSDIGWLPGEQSVESVMLVEVADDGLSTRVRTLPLLVGIGEAAQSSPPSRVVGAVESWSGRRVDHLMAIDWRTFTQLAADNDVDVSYSYGSAPAVQHEFLREVMDGTLHADMRRQPLELYRALSLTASGTAVDDEWSTLELDLLLLHLRDLRSHEITFATARPG